MFIHNRFRGFAWGLLGMVVMIEFTVIPSWAQTPNKTSRSREFLEKLDLNQNGSLEPMEVPDFARKFVERAAEKKGWKLSDPLPVAELAAAIDGTTGTNDRDRKQVDKHDSPKNGAGPQAPGFNELGATPLVPGFQVPLQIGGNSPEDYYEQRVRDQIFKEVLPKYDRNKNGMLEIGEETRDGRWQPELKESDTNQDGQLDKLELLERYAKKYNLPRSNTPITATASVLSVNSPNGSDSKVSAPAADKVREYAQGLLNRYDRSKNGMLEKDEWKEMKSEHHSADLNKDEVITIEELAAKLSGYAMSTTPTTTISTPTVSATPSITAVPKKKWWQSSSGTSKPSEKKSYRFLSPTERLPKGLPDWFSRYDTNADGQVMMSEYSAAWSDSITVEFQKHDLDADGIITPEECLAVLKTLKK